MDISRFILEVRYYVVGFRDHKEFFVWTETSDALHWGIIIKSTVLTGNTKNPTRLIRKVWQIIKLFIYLKKLPYFEVNVTDAKRSGIYMKFLSKLIGYESYQNGNNIFVLKIGNI